MSNPKAVKYRRLALVEPDPDKARLLQILADEAERGVLFTAEWRRPAAGAFLDIALGQIEMVSRKPAT